MKRFIALMLALISVFTFSISAFAIEGGTLEPKVGGSGIAYAELPIEGSERLIEESKFIRWHPGKATPERDVPIWHFSGDTSTLNVTVSASALWDSFSVVVTFSNLTNSSGCAFEKLGYIGGWSRPYIAGDIYEITYQKGYYNFNTHTWATKTGTRVGYTAKDFTVEIKTAETKAELLRDPI